MGDVVSFVGRIALFFADLGYIAVVVTKDLLALNYTGVGANDFVKLGIVKNFCHKVVY